MMAAAAAPADTQCRRAAVDQIFAQEWTTAGILEAAKGFARLKRTSTCRLSELSLRLINPNASANELKTTPMSHSIILAMPTSPASTKSGASPKETLGHPLRRQM
jgi:hypothetical protein